MSGFPTRSKCALWWRSLFGRSKSLPQAGHRTYIDPSAQFIGADFIRIGGRSIISEGCWFNVNDRSGKEPRITIGDQTYVGRRSFFSVGQRIRVGPYCLISNDCNLLGADHDFRNPFTPYLVSPVVAEGYIDIGPNCWLGSASIVLKDVSIGFGSIIGAGSVVTKAVPAFSLAVGSPACVLKRYRMSTASWVAVKEWTDDDESAIPSEEDYLHRLRASYPWVSMPVVIAGHCRGNI